jgi:hypothetical protein
MTLGPVYNNQAQTTYFEYIISKKFISKVFRGNPTLLSPENTNFVFLLTQKYKFVFFLPEKYKFVLSPENTNGRKNKFVFLNTIFVEKYKFFINNTKFVLMITNVLLLGGANTLWP